MLSANTNRLHFPAKIYLILENESPDIIRWHPNNKAFRITDHQRFEREIIPKYFRHNQMSSVQRQLNLYGFRCVSRGEDKGSFYHPKFQRGDWEGAKSIRRCVSHNQFGLQHWKLPQEMKSFADHTDVKDLEDFGDSENVAQEDDKEAKSLTAAIPINTNDITRKDWAWPPAHVVEQQRSATTTMVKAFNTTTDMAQELIHSVNQKPQDNKSQSSLTSRLGFRWNYLDNGANESHLNRDNSHANQFDFFPEINSGFDGTFGIKGHPSDTFEELIEMCHDLDSFLEDCDSTTIW